MTMLLNGKLVDDKPAPSAKQLIAWIRNDLNYLEGGMVAIGQGLLVQRVCQIRTKLKQLETIANKQEEGGTDAGTEPS